MPVTRASMLHFSWCQFSAEYQLTTWQITAFELLNVCLQGCLALIRMEVSGCFTVPHAFQPVPVKAPIQVCLVAHHASLLQTRAKQALCNRTPQLSLLCDYVSGPSVSMFYQAGICCGDFAGQLVEGQSFICMSLTTESVNSVASQLIVPSLFFYDWHLPAYSSELYPAVAALLTPGASCCNFLLNPNCWSKEAHHCVRNCANTHACSGDAVVAGSPEPSRPTVLGFTTLAGEQLLAFHKATDPLQPVALYEDVIEPGLEAGVLLYSSTAASAPSAQKLVLQMLMAQSDKKL